MSNNQFVIPAKAGIHTTIVIPAKAGIHTTNVIPAKAGIQGFKRHGFRIGPAPYLIRGPEWQ